MEPLYIETTALEMGYGDIPLGFCASGVNVFAIITVSPPLQ